LLSAIAALEALGVYVEELRNLVPNWIRFDLLYRPQAVVSSNQIRLPHVEKHNGTARVTEVHTREARLAYAFLKAPVSAATASTATVPSRAMRHFSARERSMTPPAPMPRRRSCRARTFTQR
jgi:hypothetical protein